MRTPILIQSGSLRVLLEEPLKGRQDAEGVWEYTLGFWIGRASVDAVTWDGRRFLVAGDRQHRTLGSREVRVWFTPRPEGPPALELTVRRLKDSGPMRPALVLRSRAELLLEGEDGRSFVYAYSTPPMSATYAYEIAYPDGTTSSGTGLEHLALIVNTRPLVSVDAPNVWGWLALGAGRGVVGGLILGKGLGSEPEDWYDELP